MVGEGVEGGVAVVGVGVEGELCVCTEVLEGAGQQFGLGDHFPADLFGTVAAAGIRIIAATEISRKAVLVMAVSFATGLSVELVPGILDQMPELVKSIFASGITTGGLTAILANAFIRIKE